MEKDWFGREDQVRDDVFSGGWLSPIVLNQRLAWTIQESIYLAVLISKMSK